MKKSLLLLFTTFLLVGCSNSSKGGSTPSGGGQGGVTPSQTPTTISADFTTGAQTGDSTSPTFSTKFLSYFGNNVLDYISGVSFNGYDQINGNDRVQQDGDEKETVYRLIIGSKGQPNSSLSFTFSKPLSKIEFYSECYWSGYYDGGSGPYTRKIQEDKVSLTIGSESFTLRDVANGNEGGFSLEKHEVSFATPVTSLTLSGEGRVAFSLMNLTVLV